MFESHDTSIMIDAGIGPRVLARKLSETASRVPDAIVVTLDAADQATLEAIVKDKTEQKLHRPVQLGLPFGPSVA